MTNDFLTIKQAAKLVGKSEVTIRRLIKRLLKNRTATTDKMITMTNRHGSSVYKINRTFLIEHVNLPDDFKAQLLIATTQPPDQTDISNKNDNAVDSHAARLTTLENGVLDVSSEQADYSNNTTPDHPNTHTSSQPVPNGTADGNASSNDNTTKPTHEYRGNFICRLGNLLELTL